MSDLKQSSWVDGMGDEPSDGAGLYTVNCWNNGWRLARWNGSRWLFVNRETDKTGGLIWRVYKAYKFPDSKHLDPDLSPSEGT